MTDDKIYKEAMNVLKGEKYDVMLASMNAWNNSQLAHFLFLYPLSIELLNTDFFTDFWRERRENLRVTALSDFRFMAQERLSDADLVGGYLLFLHSAVEPKKHELDERQMTSTDYLSFHIVFKHLHSMLKRLSADEDLNVFAATLYNLESFAKMHGCPGFLLLANNYLQIAVRYQRSGTFNIGQDAYRLCWNYLHLAELSESDSTAAINNAYFGCGLKLSNPLRLETISAMKESCLNSAGGLLEINIRDDAECDAAQIYKNMALADGAEVAPRF